MKDISHNHIVQMRTWTIVPYFIPQHIDTVYIKCLFWVNEAWQLVKLSSAFEWFHRYWPSTSRSFKPVQAVHPEYTSKTQFAKNNRIIYSPLITCFYPIVVHINVVKQWFYFAYLHELVIKCKVFIWDYGLHRI